MPTTLPFALFALAILSSNAVLGATPRNEREREIRALVEEKIDLKGPGVAVLVSRHGEPLHMAGYGMADIGTGAPITPDSLFDLASVAKQMTGVAILTLVEKGKLKLDEPVVRYLPDFAVPVRGREVTVTDLVHHISGLADFTSDDWDGGDAKFATLTPETHLKWLNGTKARRAPGRKYELR